MAQITALSGIKLHAVGQFSGVNENPAGDTNLKAGEAAEMRNFKISREGVLQLRPGTKTVMTLASAPVRSIWNGFVGGVAYTVAACDDKVWSVDLISGTAAEIGAFETSEDVSFLGYEEKLYMLGGSAYKVWDGETLSTVEGYRPLVAVSVVPAGGGTALERVNMLNGLRRVWFSPDGESTEYQLPETDIDSVDYIENLVTGIHYTASEDYTVDTYTGFVTFSDTEETETFTGNGSTTTYTLTRENRNVTGITVDGTAETSYTYSMVDRTVTLDSAPSSGAVIEITAIACPVSGTNTLEIGYTYPINYRADIEAMRYFETYNGTTDNRVFIYGDGTNKVYYSDLDYNGQARADYFPDLNIVHIGDANTPITDLIRHYDRLLAFKLDSAYSLSYDTVTLSDSSVTAGFYVKTVNKRIGNCACGQTRLVVNYPRTIDGRSVYEWRPTSSSGNITADQRNANLVSERIEQTLQGFSLPDTKTFVDKFGHEYYAMYGGTAVVHNYEADAWYIYTGFDPTCLLSLDGTLYGGTPDGRLVHVSRDYQSDDGTAIDALWRSGSMTFGADWARKYLTAVFLTMKPESNACLGVTLKTNEKSDYESKTVSYSLSTFSSVTFKHWSFGVNRQPQTRRVKFRARKFTYLQLILTSNTDWSTASVLAVDFKVHQIGEVK